MHENCKKSTRIKSTRKSKRYKLQKMQAGNSMNIQFKIKIIAARQLVVKDPACYTSVKLGSFQSFKTISIKSNNPQWDTVFKL